MVINLVDLNQGMCLEWTKYFNDIDNVNIVNADFFSVPSECVVSPANSFGFMDGGLDMVISKKLGWGVQETLQNQIKERPMGELLVGEALLVETGHNDFPYLISAPTMRVPTILTDTVNVYLASKAIFNLIKNEDRFNSLTISGLGTGVGRVSYDVCARQMFVAYNEVILGNYTYPTAWYVAQKEHQLLYTNIYRDLQK